jgi:hypothetical protein
LISRPVPSLYFPDLSGNDWEDLMNDFGLSGLKM